MARWYQLVYLNDLTCLTIIRKSKTPWEDLVNKNSSFEDFVSLHPYTYTRTQEFMLQLWAPISMMKQRRNTQKKASHTIQPGLTYDNRGTNRIRALVSLYWLSQSLHLKEAPNQTLHKSTEVDSTRSSWTWKKSNQILKSYAVQDIKTNFLKTTKSTDTHDWGFKWVHHTQRLNKVKGVVSF